MPITVNGPVRLILGALLIILVWDTSGQSQAGTSQEGDSPTAISARIAELTPPDKNIPENAIVLADEIRRINEELEKTRDSVDQYEQQIKSATKTKELATKTFQEIGPLNCDSPPANLSTFWDQLDRIKRAVVDPFDEDATNPWAGFSTREIRKLKPAEQCERLREIVSNQSFLASLDTNIKDLEAKKTQTNLLVEALKQRQAKLAEHNQAAETKQDIFQHLWRIIGVIGLLSIGTIFVIKLFAPQLQEQWVASGQVIQFVTVMILLSVIMALGLASILKENTLGTLLGGIAGYVLSQGVGRAAAQAVKEGFRVGQQQTPIRVGGISPALGAAAGGTRVSITGTGFDSVLSVTFGGLAGNIVSRSSTLIDVISPPHQVGAVDVVLSSNDGQTITTPGGFTFQ
jgi:hypothetical protein